MRDGTEFNGGTLVKFIGVVVFLAVALILLINTVVLVGPGERGVVKTWGAVTGNIFDEGLHFKVPVAQGVDKMNVKTQKIETSTSAASKDLQIVTSTIALNFKLKPERTAYIRQNVGLSYQSVIVDPAIQEAIKAATAKFTAEELITKRALVREQMKINLVEKLFALGGNSFIVEEFNVVNFDFSAEFNSAIEAKVTAAQQALKAERDLDRIKIEAQQKIEAAKAEAESIRIQSLALRDNPDILELRAIEKWDGVLPIVTGGAVPFIDISGEMKQKVVVEDVQG